MSYVASGEPHRLIRERREALGLSDLEVAEKSGLSIYEYGDLELRADEVVNVARLADLRRVCRTLGIELHTLFSLQPSLLEAAAQTSRSELIAKRRTELKLSQAELGDLIGFETVAVTEMEEREGFLEGWSFGLIDDLAGALQIPVESLLGLCLY